MSINGINKEKRASCGKHGSCYIFGSLRELPVIDCCEYVTDFVINRINASTC